MILDHWATGYYDQDYWATGYWQFSARMGGGIESEWIDITRAFRDRIGEDDDELVILMAVAKVIKDRRL